MHELSRKVIETIRIRIAGTLKKGFHVLVFILLTFAICKAQVSYSVNVGDNVCAGNGVIRLKVGNQAGGQIIGGSATFVISKTTDLCDYGGEFNQKNKVEIREGSENGPVVWKQTYQEGITEVPLTRPLEFTSGEKKYYAVIVSNNNLYWDGPVIISANSDQYASLKNGNISNPSPYPGQKVIFSVSYYDLENKAPDPFSSRVFVLWPGKKEWSAYSLTSEGEQFDQGVIFTTGPLNVRSTGPGEGRFRFDFKDLKGNQVLGSGEVNFFQAGIENIAPELGSQKVSPSLPEIGQELEFSVVYRDEEGDAPESDAWVEVLWPGESNWENIELIAAGDDFETGVRFATTTISTDGKKAGIGKYRFDLREMSGKPARESGLENTFTLKEINFPPSITEINTSPSIPQFQESVTFTLTYKDANNDAPQDGMGMLYVRWPGLSEVKAYPMKAENQDFVQGEEFSSGSIEVEGVPPGSADYWFDFFDANGAPAPENKTQMTLELNSVPELSNADASPSPAPLGGEIEFSILFSDLDGDFPGSGLVKVIWPGKTSPQSYSMESIGDKKDDKLKFSTGSIKIQAEQPGTAIYSFELSDNRGAAAQGNGISYEVEIKQLNTPASLSGPTMAPESPQPGSTVAFSITYTDSENDPPKELIGRVYVSWPGFGRETSHPMTTLDGDFRDGSVFSTGLVRVKSTEAGTVKYRFEFEDKNGNPIGDIHSNTFVDVDFAPGVGSQGASAVNQSQVQRDKDQPILSEPNLFPDPARLNGKVVFTVAYLDEQGEAPLSTPIVKVRWPGNNTWQEFAMTGEGKDYLTGVSFKSAPISVPGKNAGTGLFAFVFSDLNGKTALYSEDEYTFSVSESNHAPLLTQPRVRPNPGNIGDKINFKVTYTDYDNNGPDDRFQQVRVLWPGLDEWMAYPMQTDEDGFYDGAIFSTEEITALGSESGTAQYEFIFEDKSRAEAEGSGVMRYFILEKNNLAPTLTEQNQSKELLKAGETISFSAVYSDPEGTEPRAANLLILWPDQQNWKQYSLKKQGNQFVNGVKFGSEEINVEGFKAGNAQVKFGFEDGEGKPATMEKDLLSFRIRKENEDPELSGAEIVEENVKSGDPVTLQVMYSDVEGNAAGNASVKILWPGSSSWQDYSMGLLSGSPEKGQTWTSEFIIFLGSQSGKASYKFDFTDKKGNKAQGSGTVYQFDVEGGDVIANKPELPTVQRATLSSSLSFPSEIEGKAWMRFDVTYQDPDGLPPGQMHKKAFIRWPGSSQWQEYSLMGQSLNYKSGVIFSTGSVEVPVGANGTGEFKFEFETRAGDLAIGSNRSFAFSAKAPKRSSGLSGAEAAPNTVVPGKKVRFSVVFTAAENAAPKKGSNKVKVKWPGYDQWDYYTLNGDGQFFSEGVRYLTSPVTVKAKNEGEGKFQFLFQNQDGEEAEGSSAIHTFAIAIERMELAYLQAPKAGKNEMKAPIQFAWEAIEGADRYQVQVSTDREGWNPERGFGKFIYMDQVAIEPSYIWYGQLIPGRTYYWSVRTFGDGKAPSEFCSPRKFKVSSNN